MGSPVPIAWEPDEVLKALFACRALADLQLQLSRDLEGAIRLSIGRVSQNESKVS